MVVIDSVPAAANATQLVQSDAPAHFVPHTHQRDFRVPYRREAVWAWLNDPDTFVKGQIWPWFVEFVNGGMEEGVLNVHYGPGLNFAGILGEVRENEYRDLQYFYGSYAFSMRWIRPTRLQFWLRDAEDGSDETIVRLQVDSYTRRWMHGPWGWMQGIFWSRFPAWLKSGVRRQTRSQTT